MKNQIDHIIYTCTNLEEGMDEIEKLLGVRPVFSGNHPMFGTHTALLSLGNNMYFEVIAPDPSLETPAHGLWLEVFFKRSPGLSTWVMSTNNLSKLRQEAIENGIELGGIQSGKRQKTDGTYIHWQMTNPYSLPMDGLLPFAIDWGDTPHPSLNLPLVGELEALELHTPDHELLQHYLNVLQLDRDIEVIKSEKPQIIAKINTSKGTVALS